MKLEIKSDWDTADSEGKSGFTVRLIKENGEVYYCASHSECYKNEYSTYQSLQATFMELLHIAYPDAVKQEFDERKKILEGLK